MADSRADERFDDLVSQVHDWTESAVARDLRDLISELKDFLEDEGEGRREEVLEAFATPEMAEVVQRFPKVRRLLESAWGAAFTEMLEEEQGFGGGDEDDDDD